MCADYAMQLGRSRHLAFTLGLLAATSLAGPAQAADAAAVQPSPAITSAIAPNPLLSIDQNRGTVVERIMATWGEALAASGAGVTREQLQVLLTGMRSDYLLAASLTGSLEGLRTVIANGITANAPTNPALIQTKALGDAADDLLYTPVVPCRLADTRNAGGPITGGGSRNFKVWVASGGFAAQGGSAGNCNIPANPAAVALNLAVVSPGGPGNLIVYPTGAVLPNTSALNYQSGFAALANGAIVPACIPNCANQVTVKTNGAGTDVVIDIVGYFNAPAGGNIAISGNLTLADSASPAAGNIMKGSAPFIHNFGLGNTFVGVNAGNFGMISNITPPDPVTGAYNTAVGVNALYGNTTGAYNTATGLYALESNTTGMFNTANGEGALQLNTTGSLNTAIGQAALLLNTEGGGNTAVGRQALNYNDAYNNTAVGYFALYGATGNYNVAIGEGAGQEITTGNANIMIANSGTPADSNTIRIGESLNFHSTFIGGIAGVNVAGVPVLISGDQLGVAVSSRRFKDDIADMDDASAALMKLRPVTFHYKSDPSPSGHTLQYGLIAEEVAAVYPALVAHSADGQIETIKYQFLPPMLLNEYQKQQRTIEAQMAEMAKQTTRIAELEKQTAEIALLKQDRQMQMAEMGLLKQQMAQVVASQAQSAQVVAAGK